MKHVHMKYTQAFYETQFKIIAHQGLDGMDDSDRRRTTLIVVIYN